MRIHHLAIWCQDIEAMRTFYTTYFDCTSNSMYHNPTKGFSSYFISFAKDDDCKIELMHRADIADNSASNRAHTMGFAHFDIEVGTQDDVLALIQRLRADGYTIASEPRHTGDGYFEAAVLDPEGNYVEISATKDN